MKKWIRMIALLSAVGMVAIGCGSDAESPAPTPVSYTHLTLPTIYSV